jgi:hypothetical protein
MFTANNIYQQMPTHYKALTTEPGEVLNNDSSGFSKKDVQCRALYTLLVKTKNISKSHTLMIKHL